MSWAIKQNSIICLALSFLPTPLLPKAVPSAEPHGPTMGAQVNGGARVPWHGPQDPSLWWGREWHILSLVPQLCFGKDLKMGSHTLNSLG